MIESEEIPNRSRRQFMVAGSAAVVSPMFLGLIEPAEAAAAQTGKAGKEKVYYITRKCIGCHACKIFCPQKAIFYGVRKMEIDQDKCVQCGTCYSECPISVIEEIRL